MDKKPRDLRVLIHQSVSHTTMAKLPLYKQYIMISRSERGHGYPALHFRQHLE
jgi:hypothetical protein